MTTLGVVFRPQNPPERLRSVARAADEAGLEELWLWEDCFLESGIAAMTAALAWTERLKVGIGLLPVPFRNVAVMGMEAATLQRLFPDRAIITLGHGVQDWMGQVGARVDSPMTLLREHIEALKALLAGETVTTTGRYVQLDKVKLDYPPLGTTPVYAGATGPKTRALACEVADGILLTAGTYAHEVAAVREAAKAITVYVYAATGPDAAERMARELESWGESERTDTTAVGDAAAVAAVVKRYQAAGADAVILQPTADEPDLEGFVRFVAQDVRALV
ncbi:oxidoreductase [Actinoplanes italicus]|uniref:Alkanesulfonate monooxygenase SsuD/methylene tetrahydromethanopterin reductase-like flavin-dependent oxidoreductase (Luciferase family) n=1 Tax=Actinoplanes italicus TaxID=113567 RepID=A0A2T0KFD9_9ACTN|nr:LLM class flavin-dependent oxidoreductase [Actinoplanes italicus]PRX21878.1 alkanesulfonate monooxygenase SsuD/methylene tetrahydromethanopterin reductase-like flavin-dependent oxidoreductase (luciferase family) [Actinoplanes italicus]GIE29704.1 oxidoreductase [Actinoplanes italicus]